MNKYKAKLTARYQKSGNNFISSDEGMNAKPDHIDMVEDFVEEYDGVPYYSKPARQQEDYVMPQRIRAPSELANNT